MPGNAATAEGHLLALGQPLQRGITRIGRDEAQLADVRFGQAHGVALYFRAGDAARRRQPLRRPELQFSGRASLIGCEHVVRRDRCVVELLGDNEGVVLTLAGGSAAGGVGGDAISCPAEITRVLPSRPFCVTEPLMAPCRLPFSST